MTALGAPRAAAQPVTVPSIPARKVETAPKIDGVLDDACWTELPRVSGFTDERLGTPVEDDTTAWIGYDDENIYVAFHCGDSDPEGIVARETRRGAGLRGEDRIRVTINPFNSKRGGDESRLSLNPLGTQDTDFAGGRAGKQEWEGEWQSAARIVDDGWTAEMAVPWRHFVRPDAGGAPITLGLNFDRYQARTQTDSWWSNVGPRWRSELMGEWTGVLLPPAKRQDPLSILMYTYGGHEAGENVTRSGFDARYQATPRLTGLATVNPDLSNVESAVTSIDFSYSERLPDETRPFFLEGRDYYGWWAEGISPFASVRIPMFDVGGKFYGRVGDATDVGLLTTRNFGDRRDTVASMEHALSPYDSLDFQAVSLVEGDISNQVLAGKARARRGDWSGQIAYSRSRDRAPVEEGPGIQTASDRAASASLSWGKGAWAAWGAASTIGSEFLPRNGYVSYVDQRGGYMGMEYDNQWRSGPIRDFEWGVDAHHYTREDGGFFRSGVSTRIEARTDRELLGWARYSIGRFEENDDRVASVGLSYPALNKFRNARLSYSWGRLGGAPYRNISPGISWRFMDRLSVGLSTEIVRHEGTHTQHILSLSYDIARDIGVGGRVVQRNARTNGYLSFRKSGYGGTEAFLILGDPNAETFTSRAILKIVRPM